VDAYVWLFRTCRTFNGSDPVITKATDVLPETFRIVNDTANIWMNQQRDPEAVKTLELLKSFLKELRNASQ
jgi:hypothetical protein